MAAAGVHTPALAADESMHTDVGPVAVEKLSTVLDLPDEQSILCAEFNLPIIESQRKCQADLLASTYLSLPLSKWPNLLVGRALLVNAISLTLRKYYRKK